MNNTIKNIILLIIFTFGLFLIFSSLDIGVSITHTKLFTNTASADTDKYYLYINLLTQNIRTIGAVISISSAIIYTFKK